MKNYFEIFNLPTKYDINIAELEETYLNLQRRYHPDNFLNNSEKKIAYQNIININQAYKILNSDLLRAEYIMQLNGIILGTENDSIKPSQDILIHALNDRQLLEDISPDKLEEYLKENKIEFADLKKKFSNYLQKNDIENATNTAIIMRYKYKLITDIENKLE